MTSPVRDRLFSFEEYLAYDDGTDNRYELVDGSLELMNPPTFKHILIAKFLERSLEAEISRLGLPWMCFREAGIRTGLKKSRLSDLYIIPSDRVQQSLDASAVCETPPLFVTEIVSPDSIVREYRYKRSEYAALGIPEYWIVDPLKRLVTVLFLESGLYEETEFAGDRAILFRTFPELLLTPNQVLAVGEESQSGSC